MITKHTPGPWHLSRSGQYVRKNDTADWPAWNVAEINTATEAWEANARLIAAAPDLLAACAALAALTRDLLKLVTAEQITQSGLERRMLTVSEQGFNALSKARGESS